MAELRDPGWYLDPDDAHAERWWDGMAWTSFVRPAPEVVGPDAAETAATASAAPSSDASLADGPLPDAPQPQDPPGSDPPGSDPQASDPASEPGAPPGWYADPWGGAGQRWYDGAAWTGSTIDVPAAGPAMPPSLPVPPPSSTSRTSPTPPTAPVPPWPRRASVGAVLFAVLAGVIFVVAGINLAALRSVAGGTVAEAFYNGVGWISIGAGLLVFATVSRWR